jgi:hypothetical protein
VATDCGATMTDSYLSKNRDHLRRLQRERRARMVRIDYMPSHEALLAIQAKQADERSGSVAATNSAVIDAIVKEWMELAGINKHGRFAARHACPELLPTSRTRAHANESRDAMPELSDQYARVRMTSDLQGALATPAENRGKQAAQRFTCGARRHRDGLPCQAKSEPGKHRCRFHGGRSTGPRTPEGRARALANLKQQKSEGQDQGCDGA